MPDASIPDSESEPQAAPATSVGSGVNLNADRIDIGGDVVGRDLITTINNFFAGTADEARNERNKLILLGKVKKFWIEGVLEQSIHNAVLIDLGREVRSDVVDRPWDTLPEATDITPYVLPPGKQISEVFKEMDRALLILGEPGSGKTITLLELARELIQLAERDASQPIPVVLNLSSWVLRCLPLQDWLVEELNAKYQIPRKIGRAWLEQDALILLLDGLDEVMTKSRTDCALAINLFRQTYGLAGIAVCSRTSEYQALTIPLNLHAAIQIQPLTFQQAISYLEKLEPELEVLHAALLRDVVLRDLAQSPLILNIMLLAYRGASSEALPATTSVEDQYQRLFDTYVQRMLQRRPTYRAYTPKHMVRWLAWLARMMAGDAQTEFFIEGLTPTWLPTHAKRRVYTLMVGLVSSSLLALALVLGATLATVLGLMLIGGQFSPDTDMAGFIPFVLFTGVAVMLGCSASLVLKPMQAAALTATLMIGFSGLVGSSSGEWLVGMAAGALLGIPSGLIVWSVADRGHIKVTETLRWSWRRSSWGLIVGGLVFLLLAMLINLADAAEVALPTGLSLFLVFGLSGGEDLDRRTAPNQGMRRSFRNALRVGVVALTVCLLMGAIISILEHDLRIGLTFGLFVGVIASLIAALVAGGAACLQHIILRFILAWSGCLPWQLTSFLNDAAEHIFLRKVGGGYIFIHRLLMEYFAQME